jgi:hypothetical protein
MPMQEMDENFHPIKWHPNPLIKGKARSFRKG